MFRNTSTPFLAFAIPLLLAAAAPTLADPGPERGRSGYQTYGRDHGRGHDSHSGRGGVSISIGLGLGALFGHAIDYRPQPAGYYTTRDIQVLVEPAHYQQRYIPAVTQIGYDHCGRRIEYILSPARYESCYIPARYETRCQRIWVPYSHCR